MGKIANQHIIERLNAQFGDKFTSPVEPFGLLTFETTANVISEILTFLKNDEELKFGYLTDITAVHYPEQEKAIGVLYHLHSLVNNVRIRIKVFIDVIDCHIPTATVLWNGANWMERETYDLFGVNFDGHPDLRRILLPSDFDGHALRKDYPLRGYEPYSLN